MLLLYKLVDGVELRKKLVQDLPGKQGKPLMAHRRSTVSSILEVFSLNPLPYPVILFLCVIFIFLGIQWYVSYESVVEAAEENMGWALLAAPLLILFAVRWLSTVENPDGLFGWNRRRRTNYLQSEGSSPWGVAALILVLLVMVQYHSTFLDSWYG
ncbi:hypothetical protein RJ639_037821 [Escallonia herrerae]|uniref:Uncharacterized protein n=1 Tax=Escallonia herrerae TaxID=1293975 RepID=A0AA88WIS2_9ASTE|nr:hypothetical protein RJ639_037821 [Escallonia herrerae]